LRSFNSRSPNVPFLSASQNRQTTPPSSGATVLLVINSVPSKSLNTPSCQIDPFKISRLVTSRPSLIM
jgi:hypothetical protein